MNGMTGFGRAEGESATLGISLRIEVSSVNRKQFDVRFLLPSELSFEETMLRRRLAERLSRGWITVRAELFHQETAAAQFRVDRAFFTSLVKEARELAEQTGCSGELLVERLLSVPGVVVPAPPVCAMPEFEPFLIRVFDEALEKHIAMRRNEGEAMAGDILRRIELLERTLDEVCEKKEGMAEVLVARMRERLKQAGFSAEADDERIMREFAIFADRLDVTEEITRLRSHFRYFRDLVAHEASPGRSLDFLVQEMFRETNTLGNKSGSVDVSPLIVRMKTELEKIREQVQNIE